MLKKIAMGIVSISMMIASASSFAAPVCSVGESASVLWKGKWYAAHVSRVNETQTKCFVHYDGYGNDWDEWVGAERIKIKRESAPALTPDQIKSLELKRQFEQFENQKAQPQYRSGEAVMILWKNKWYPGFVMEKAEGGKFKVHYDGYGKEWDEWLGSDRLMKK